MRFTWHSVLAPFPQKRERHAKRQQRYALQLALSQALRSGDHNGLEGYGLALGRSRRERKPVNYTFGEGQGGCDTLCLHLLDGILFD